jgi:putative transposase
MQYKRSRAKGASYFFTVVTQDRRRFLCDASNVTLLREAFLYVMDRNPFSIDAFVLLPEHLHCIWTLPENDSDYSNRWRLIKSHFSRKWMASNKREQVWQHRFWEHQIRNGEDLIRHVEYIHYNPVKHGLVKSPYAWEHSTFRRYVEQGTYHADWGASHNIVFDVTVGNE